MNYKSIGNVGIDNSAANISWLVNEAKGVPNVYVEVGVFEGITSCWVGDNLGRLNPNLEIICIDPHVGSNDLDHLDFNEIRDHFLDNIGMCSHKKIEYIQEYSNVALMNLYNRGTKANLIYIDGDHRASTVLSDLVLAWQILPVGGIILCDDHTGWHYREEGGGTQMSPRMAIETFIMCNWHKIHTIPIPKSAQVAFAKIAE